MFKFLAAILFFQLPMGWAKPVDVVFDIDQTIATKIHDGPHGDLLADPKNPSKGVVQITYDKPLLDSQFRTLKDAKGHVVTKKVTERYRIYEGTVELMQKLTREQQAGKLRLSFFSGASVNRTKALLEAIKLNNGANLYQTSQKRVYGSQHLSSKVVNGDARYRERFKKDLTVINKNLDDVILIDDIKEFVPKHQSRHVLWLGEDFPYPERRTEGKFTKPSAEAIARERNKIKWVDQQLKTILSRREQGVSTLQAMQEVTFDGTRTPATVSFKKSCSAGEFQKALKILSEAP